MKEESLIYTPDFMSQRAATELMEFIRGLESVRPLNKRDGGKSYLRRISYPGYAPSAEDYRAAARVDHAGTLMTAPGPYQDLSSNLTAFAGGNEIVNYASTIAYLPDDYMAFHQHHEDTKRENQKVWVLSLGSVHPINIRWGATVKSINPKTGKLQNKFVPNGRTAVFQPSHGSLYTLPTCFNLPGSGGEAEHSVLPGDDWSFNGLRVSINCKHIPDGLTEADFNEAASRPAGRSNSQSGSLDVREPGTLPRIYNASGKYPLGAIYCGRGGTFAGRDFPPSPFGNYAKHKLKTEAGRRAWAAEVEQRMANADFRQQVLNLKGKDLICHCSQKENKNGECHAATWLRLANEEAK